MSVLFPAPDGPISAHISPGCSVRFTLWRMRVPPADTPTFSTRRGPSGELGVEATRGGSDNDWDGGALNVMSSWREAKDVSIQTMCRNRAHLQAREFMGLGATLDAAPLRRDENEDGSVRRTEVRINDTVVMMGEAPPGWSPVPCHIHIYVPDVDATYAAALENGGESVQAPVQKGDPDRRAGVRGPGGNTWWFGTQMTG